MPLTIIWSAGSTTVSAPYMRVTAATSPASIAALQALTESLTPVWTAGGAAWAATLANVMAAARGSESLSMVVPAGYLRGPAWTSSVALPSEFCQMKKPTSAGPMPLSTGSLSTFSACTVYS